jgi:hypothetical protein
MGFSLSHQSKINLLDIVGHQFADALIDEIKAGKKLQGIGDNWDLRMFMRCSWEIKIFICIILHQA